MFDKKDDNSNSTTDVFRPAKGSAKVVIGHGVLLMVKLKKLMKFRLMVKQMLL